MGINTDEAGAPVFRETLMRTGSKQDNHRYIVDEGADERPQ